MIELRIEQRPATGVSVACVTGRLDVQGADVLEAHALQRLAGGELRLVLDLAEVDYVSSAGLRSLLVVAKKVQSIHGRLALCCLTPMVLNVINISGFQQLLQICGTQEEALAAVGSPAA
jgi:anti-anti-sigma factor